MVFQILGDDPDVQGSEGDEFGPREHERRGMVPSEDKLSAENAETERGQ